MLKTCVGCNNLFEAKTKRATRCRKNCGRKQSSTSANGARTKQRTLTDFIGVDGEGVTREDGTHDYVLLSVGNESLYNPDGSRLTWREIFPFLYDQYKENPHAAFVGYYLGYDFTQWFRGLSENRARALLSKEGIAKRSRKNSGGNPMPFPVHVGEWEWEIDILGMKRFMLRPGMGFPPGGGVKNPHKWMYICDVGPFFQQSFLKTISEWAKNGTVSAEELAVIIEGKERRSDAVFDKDMIRYNILENDILSRIMPILNEGFKGANIALDKRRWYGPGQAAQQWLTNIDAPTGEMIQEIVPQNARDAARKSYFGGWFEIFRHGPIPGTTYEYDINSAYPYIISNLPCLIHGRWTSDVLDTQHELTPCPNGSLRIVHGVATGSHKWIGTLLHRTSKGGVHRPSKTSGYYWQHEIEAAISAGLIDSFMVDEWHQYDTCGCPSPFGAIADLYQERLNVGKNSPHGKAYKLIYNSAYGKMAQSIGTPKFANPIYASLITAGCRTMILEAIATHPVGAKDVLMVATDGVYFKSPHTALDLSDSTLGAWDETRKENMTLFMPGIYWDDATRTLLKEGKDPKLKSRGINARDLANHIDEIDAQFKAWRMGDEWPSLTIPVTFSMVSPGQALSRNKWETCGNISTDTTKRINAEPSTKRTGYTSDDDNRTIIASQPFLYGYDIESTPYERTFGDIGEDLQDVGVEYSPDGIIRNIGLEFLNIK